MCRWTDVGRKGARIPQKSKGRDPDYKTRQHNVIATKGGFIDPPKRSLGDPILQQDKKFKQRDQLSLRKTLLSYKSDIMSGAVRTSPKKKKGKCNEKYMHRKDDTDWKPCFRKKEYKYTYPRP